MLIQLQPQLEKYLDKELEKGVFTENTKRTTRAMIKSGLQPCCITRDLFWGSPVPLENFTEKVFYVWFDTPIGYVSITANYTDQWEQWWKNPNEV